MSLTINTGTDLRNFRKSLGMTQFEFAKTLGFSLRKKGNTENGYITAMESGRRPISRLTKLLCQKLERTQSCKLRQTK